MSTEVLALVNPDQVITHNGAPVAIKDLAPPLRALAGMGHNPYDISNRDRHPGEWKWTPDTCLRASATHGQWINDEQDLVCPGCGLDYT